MKNYTEILKLKLNVNQKILLTPVPCSTVNVLRMLCADKSEEEQPVCVKLKGAGQWGKTYKIRMLLLLKESETRIGCQKPVKHVSLPLDSKKS